MSAARAGSPVDVEARAAIAASHFSDVPEELLEELLYGARRLAVAAGTTIHHEGEHAPHIELVVRGLVRVHVTAPDGRTLTVRYCRVGALMGILSLYSTPFVMPATTQAVVDSDLLAIRPAVLQRLADRHVRVAKVLILELSERASAFVTEIAGSTFSSVRQRTARHLLDLASERQRGAELVAPISQQDLADAVGTAREVVVRTLREMRREGVVETGRGQIAIVAPERLIAEMYGQPAHVPAGRNTSP